MSLWTSQTDGSALAADFSVGGWGMGSQTDYWGIYTTTDGGPAGFQGTDMALAERSDGVWTWREEQGDNTYETRRIAPGWYSYRVHF